MKSFIHNKKDPETTTPDVSAENTAMEGQETAASASDETLSAKDVETENLKNAIAQVIAEETAALPHREQLSSAVAKESGLIDEKTDAKDEAQAEEQAVVAAAVPEPQAKISSWFVTFMAMRIPIVGWIYLLYLAFSRKTKNRRNFARAYLLIKLIFLILGIIILFLVISMAMNILQDLLDYMAML